MALFSHLVSGTSPETSTLVVFIFAVRVISLALALPPLV